ncbi:osmolarity sensor protein EnvZ [bacterium BMS3Bbin10]|nr:osmolarity sensor protein EnvZ [bacterium BMS3Bbin10]
MRRLIPDTIAARTLLVLLIGLTVSHLLSVALYFNDRTSALLFTIGKQTGERITSIQRLVENAPQAERRRIVEHADHPRLHVAWSQESTIEAHPDKGWQSDVLLDALVAHLNAGGGQIFRLRYSDGAMTGAWQEHMRKKPKAVKPGQTLMVSLRLSDGSWLNFAAPIEPPKSFWSLRFVLSMGIMLLGVGILSTLVVRHLTRPLGTFARAAHRLGTDVKAPPIPEKGPAEVRQAIRAFNEMQGRLRRFIEDRTQMLAAISHDLGTPITRLRLRAEFIEDEDQQEKMLADLDDMEKMVSSALSFARDEATSEPHAMVDLRTLLQRVCDDTADAGHAVTLDIGDNAVPFACRSVALRRALSNLIGNAVKYGRRARVSLAEQDDAIVITIDDDGPGIPEDRLEDVFKPFRRLEESRSRETGGTGLGLTVARTIVRAHGGGIALSNRDGGGLSVEVKLPR